MATLSIQQNEERSLMREMGLTEESVERRRGAMAFGAADVKRLASLKTVVGRRADEIVGAFFEYLAKLDEAQALFADPKLLETARRMKREHIVAMVSGDYRLDYVEQRIKLGLLYSRVGLDHTVFLGAFHHLLATVADVIVKHERKSAQNAADVLASFQKIAFVDLAVIVDVLVYQRERIIRQQQTALQELSTPVLQLRERLLILPIIGVLDSLRARQLTERLLDAIRATRARVVVVDITGVAVVDSKVANHIVQTVAAARLMGASVIVTGLSAEVAQTLVTIGVDLGKLGTVGDLQGGIEEAEALLGYRVTRADASQRIATAAGT